MAEARKRYSIRGRLLGWLLATVAAAWLVTLAASYVDARHEVEEILDAHLAQTAALLAAEAGHELAEIDTEELPALHRYGRKLAFQVSEKGRELRLHSPNAPLEALSAKQSGFSNASAGGANWRVFSLWDAGGGNLVQVGERRGAREEIALRIIVHMLWPLVVVLPILALLIWLAVTRGLRPLAQLGEQVARREPGNLAPVAAADAPLEVAPLADDLNRLFDRVRASMESERRFTADAAHELRTPLAALRAQVQVARGAPSDSERRHALDGVIAGCDRAAHLVEQMLTLARVDAQGAGAIELRRVDLAAAASSAIARLAPAALERGVELELAGSGAAAIRGDAGLVKVLVSNLLDNAVRYSPAGGKVRVEIEDSGAGVKLTVSDRGPGIAPEERDNVWRRFYRISGSDVEGSGLGLSIVRRVADIHGARIALADYAPGSGLSVAVIFPRA